MRVPVCLALMVAVTGLAVPADAQQASGSGDIRTNQSGSDDVLGGAYDSGAGQPVLRGGVSGRAETAAVRADDLSTGAVPAAAPVLPPAPRRITAPDVGPYDALGLRLGAFVVYPKVETGITYSDDVFRNDGASSGGDIASVIRPSLRIESDWSRHALSFEANSEHELFSKSSSEDSNSVTAALRGRIDVRQRTTIDVSGEYQFDQDDRGSNDIAATAAELPDQHAVRLGAAITQRFNRVSVQLRGALEDNSVDDTRLVGGGRDDNDDRAYTELAGTLRVSYAHTPAVQPFAEITFSRRDHDQKIDDNGQRRDSEGITASGGVALDFGPPLSGEVALGYIHAGFDDGALRNIDDVFARASLTWRPSALTTLTASLHTGIEETTLIGASGAIERRFELAVSHALRGNIILLGGFAFERQDFKGSRLVEETIEVEAGIEYRLNRNLAVRGRYAYEEFSDNAGGGFASNSAVVELEFRK